MNSKAQIFTLDFILGLLAFIFLVVIAVKLISGIFIDDEFSSVYADATHISEVLISSGYPQDWTSADLVMLGITDDQRINLTKLAAFDSLDSDRKKTLLQTRSDFLFTFNNRTDTLNVSGCMHGIEIDADNNCSLNFSSIDYTDLTKVERLVIYNSTPVRMVVYAWQ